MLHLAFLFATLILAACSTAPVKSNQSQAVSPIQGVHTESQKSAIDSVIQFLLKSAAADFYVHGPKPILHFRDVRIGHDMPSSGEKLYMLCGQFMPARDGDKAEWIPFVTIKTSGYEQYIGNHAATFYQKSSFVWDDVGNLSSLLQSQLDSLR